MANNRGTREIQIVDLPGGHHEFRYAPTQPSFYKVRTKKEADFNENRFDLHSPLILHIGDTVQFLDHEEIPTPIAELCNKNSAHPMYAILTVVHRTPGEKVNGENEVLTIGDAVFVGHTQPKRRK